MRTVPPKGVNYEDEQEPKVACHACGGGPANPITRDCLTCEGEGRVPLSEFDGSPGLVAHLVENLNADGWCFPVTERVGEALSEQLIRIDTANHALVIRLELGFIHYGEMEDLLRDGIQARADRVKALELYKSANKGRIETRENPLSLADIDYAIRRAQDDHRAAIALTHRVSRPKP